MKTIHWAEVEFSTELFLSRRKYWFNTKEERLAFIGDADVKYGARLIGFGLDHLVASDDALEEIGNEIRRAKECLGSPT
jgi:hypothetical protein